MASEIKFWQLPFVMLKILHHLGSSPNIDSYTDESFLDLENGAFSETLLPLKHTADEESSKTIYTILQSGIHELPASMKLRSKVIQDLIRYFRWHVKSDLELNSMETLSSLSQLI